MFDQMASKGEVTLVRFPGADLRPDEAIKSHQNARFFYEGSPHRFFDAFWRTFGQLWDPLWFHLAPINVHLSPFGMNFGVQAEPFALN